MITPLVEQARRFGADQVDPNAARWEREHRLDREALRRAADVGLCGLFVSTEHGGLGCRVGEAAEALGAVAAGDMGFAFSLVCHNNLAGAISARGSDEQRARHLPPMLEADRLGAFLLTEPSTGSDAAAITTHAVPDGDGWRLTGEKAWVTNATEADVLSVYAQTEPGSGSKGIAAFLVDAKQHGVERLDGYHLLGAHTTGTGGFAFNNVELSPNQLFIEPGQALSAALASIDTARVLVASMCCAMVERSLDVAVDRLKTRSAFGRPLSDQQGLRWMLADVATELRAARALTDQATAAIEYGDAGADGGASRVEATQAAAHAKKFATRMALTALSDCMQALGADGFRHDHPIARHLAAAKMAQYLDGTTEIQNVVIARHLFGDRASR